MYLNPTCPLWKQNVPGGLLIDLPHKRQTSVNFGWVHISESSQQISTTMSIAVNSISYPEKRSVTFVTRQMVLTGNTVFLSELAVYSILTDEISFNLIRRDYIKDWFYKCRILMTLNDWVPVESNASEESITCLASWKYEPRHEIFQFFSFG